MDLYEQIYAIFTLLRNGEGKIRLSRKKLKELNNLLYAQQRFTDPKLKQPNLVIGKLRVYCK